MAKGRANKSSGTFKNANAEKLALLQFAATGPISRLVPMVNNEFVRLRLPDVPKDLHTRTNSEAFYEELRREAALFPPLRDRLIKELQALQVSHPGEVWDKALEVVQSVEA